MCNIHKKENKLLTKADWLQLKSRKFTKH